MSAAAVAQAPHLPVLLDEVLAGLAVQPGETHVDGTFGAGGYTRALLGAGAGRVIAFDRDPDAIADGPSLALFTMDCATKPVRQGPPSAPCHSAGMWHMYPDQLRGLLQSAVASPAGTAAPIFATW